MKSPAQRRTAQRRMAFVAALLAPTLVACGFGAQTDKIYQAAQGVDDRSTSVKVLNAVVVAAANGSGTFAGSFVNESGQTQTLEQVSAEGVTASKNAATIAVAPQQLLNLGNPVTGRRGQALPLLALTGAPIEIGKFVRLTFTFSEAGTVTLNVPIVSNSAELGHEYADVPMAPGTEPTTEPSSGETEDEHSEDTEESGH